MLRMSDDQIEKLARHDSRRQKITAGIIIHADRAFEEDGGPGSGNHHHAGRPGFRGGSAKRGSGGGTFGNALQAQAESGIITTGSSGSGSYNPKAFKKTEPKTFLKTFHQAKAEVAKIKPEDAWRVDSSYTEEDYADMDCYVTEGGSAVAVHDGDIVSVCKNPNDKTCRGSDLLTHAVANGGTKLDAFSGLYGFYIKNGFEPVSWCEFDEEYAPPDWDKNRDDPEPVIFFKYTGAEYDQIVKKHGADKDDFISKVKVSAGYNAAKKVRDDSL